MKKVLIIGGTRFVGRNLIEQMLPLAQYDLTMFNRGKTNPDLFPEIKHIIGDRDTGDLHKAAQQDWDCIIDISGYYPNPLEEFLQQIKGKVGRYIYVSTTGVYSVYDDDAEWDPELMQGNMKEDFPRCSYNEAVKTDENKATYVKRKTACEDVILSQDWLDAIILRPAYIVGHYDFSDRLYHWFYKVKMQDTFILPDGCLMPFTDVLDFSKIMIQTIDIKNNYAIYNASSYDSSIKNYVQLAAEHLNKTIQLVNVNTEFIEAQMPDFNIYAKLPLWTNYNCFTVNRSRLQKDFNFTFSTIEETTERLMDYYGNHLKWQDIRERDSNTAKNSMTVEQEAELMKLLREKS